jgi:hypothetical protein
MNTIQFDKNNSIIIITTHARIEIAVFWVPQMMVDIRHLASEASKFNVSDHGINGRRTYGQLDTLF